MTPATDNPNPNPTHNPAHVPVLRRSCLELLAPKAGDTYLDCTAGLGGHAASVAPALGSSGTIILNDVDPANLRSAAAHVRDSAPAGAVPTIMTVGGNFAELPRTIERLARPADIVLADLGFSSNQMDDPSRGMSFMRDGPLDMRLDPSLATTAAELVNTRTPEELIEILRDFGEERQAPAIVRKLVRERAASPITTTARLAQLVRAAMGPGALKSNIDPATRTFQALRIAVNDEIGVLEAFMSAVVREAHALAANLSADPAPSWLNPGARIGVISFHSLEDRVVKRGFTQLCQGGLADDVSNGVREASPDEVEQNPRSRSAKLRVIRLRSPSSAGRAKENSTDAR
jgi:16S rRNA (cytosine1402-N4)-methyltransferase